MKYRKFKIPTKEYLSLDRLQLLKLLDDKGYYINSLDDFYQVIEIIKDNKSKIINLSNNINSTNTLTFFKDKICTYRILELLKINYPNGTYFVNNYKPELINDIKQHIANKYKNGKFVIKPNNSSRNNGVFIFNEINNNLNFAINNSFEFSDVILIQNFIVGQEYRFICIENKIIFGIEKFEFPKKSILCSQSIINRFQWIADKIHELTKALIFGIDIRVNGDNYSVIEINSRPGLTASFDTYTDKQKEYFYSYIINYKINH